MNIISQLMGLAGVIDEETKELFGEFCGAAIASGNPNRFVKDALKAALEPPKPEPPPRATVEVRDVGEEEPWGPKRRRSRTRRR